MAKGGARKKTKWVSLSLASATATVPPAKNGADESFKSSRGTKSYTAVVTENGSNYISNNPSDTEHSTSSDYHHNASDRRLDIGSRRQPVEGDNPPHSNAHFSHRSYAARSSHHNIYNSSGRKPNYSSHNGGASYRSQYSADAKNEQHGTVTINEDEYTKITTPRQDVLFKKGYLSRPRNYATTTASTSENGIITASSSVNGTTDGSDMATGSGSVSTAESVISDSTYLTDAQFVEYPTPYPYFGYFDQSGVLVMNGFAVDNNGFSYLNGGQTYIYPPNYHCQATVVDDDQKDNVQRDDSEAVHVAEESKEGLHATEEALIDDSVITDASLSENVKSLISEQASSCTQQDHDNSNVNVLTNETDIVAQTEGDETSIDLDQNVPQQQMMLPYADGYEYAQFCNAFYYPGCVVAPFPIVSNGMYYDQYEEEHARQLGFRKRRKRYRNWEEYPTDVQLDGMTEFVYHDPNIFYTPESYTSAEVPDSVVISEHVLDVQQSPQPAASTSDSSYQLPSSQSEDPSSQSGLSESQASPKSKPRSQQTQEAVTRVPNKTKPQSQKTRKKDLIEATRAFAEQNIDLTKSTCRQKTCDARSDESNTWKVMRNGREVVLEEDRELRYIDSKAMSKMEAIKEIPETLPSEEVRESVVAVTATGATPEGMKHGKKDTSVKKGKKTAKGKGKKQKKNNLAQHQTGFEVIEPEFSSSPLDEITTEQEAEESQQIDEHSILTVEPCLPETYNDNKHEQMDIIVLAEGDVGIEKNDSVDECVDMTSDIDEEVLLEQDLHDVQANDLGIGEAFEFIDAVLQIDSSESVNISEQENCEDTQFKQEEITCTATAVKQDVLIANDVPLVLSENTYCLDPLPVYVNLNNDVKTEMLTKTCTIVDNYKASEGSSPSSNGDDDHNCRHFSGEEYSEAFDSGVQSPAAFVAAVTEERKSSSSSYNSSEIHVTDAVTKWLSETLSNKRLEELFVLPDDPTLLHRIHQFNLLNFDDSFAFSSDTYSSSSCDEAEDGDSDYMSDVQVKKRQLCAFDSNQKTESQKDQLDKQTANGFVHENGNHSNHKQKRCIIM